MQSELLKNYADIIVKVGVNLVKGQAVEIFTPVECADFARLIAQSAYENGASEVEIEYADEKFSRLRMQNQTRESLETVPEWRLQQKRETVDKGTAHIGIDAGDPMIFAGIDSELLQGVSNARYKALDFYYKEIMSNGIRWCLVAYPTIPWSRKVFPELSDIDGYNKLFEAIQISMRLNTPNPVAEWEKHRATLNRRSIWLNNHNFDCLKFKNSKGTDLTVGLAEGHFWTGAFEKAKDNVVFCANMPSEEIFTAPHRDRVNGTLVNALPLAHGGNIIDGFKLTFKDGRVVEYSAEKGYETLKNLIETDEGSHYLGEVALVGKNSIISNQNILFYSTLFDENASCHLAIGEGYPTTIVNGNALTAEEKAKCGLNDSLEHVDFMIGTSDLNIVGVKKDGEEISVFVDGEWVI